MNEFTKELVDSYAEKLLIGLTEEENKFVLQEFDAIKKSMEFIAQMPNIEKIEPMTHALDDFTFTLREDKKEESLPIEDIVKNCKKYEDREIVVPRVVNKTNE
ncbi:MAG: Asp-tRNA(Asn)/Glu-tRNA(Gln) amidotransferase subunit GatC [Bacilli bacterium]|nr:Asp-tRNA(Asn)/Glu-tRNA(Gln) amidotransferase subunit GatC [Bacilli bacterium]